MELTADTLSQNCDDPTLAGRFIRGEERAFDELARLYGPRVKRLAQRLLGWSSDADDVVQDVFVTALQKHRSFRAESSLWTWLASITINACHNRGRLHQRWLRWLSKGFREAEPSPPADSQETVHESRQRIIAAVQRLADAEREVVVLVYLEQMPVTQVMQLLSLNRGAVDTRLHRARKKLAEQLKDLDQD